MLQPSARTALWWRTLSDISPGTKLRVRVRVRVRVRSTLLTGHTTRRSLSELGRQDVFRSGSGLVSLCVNG